MVNKRGKSGGMGLGLILPLIMILMLAGIYLGASLYVQEEFKGEVGENTTAYYAINDTQNAIGKVSSMMTLVAVISVIVIIITLLTIGLGGVSRVS